MITFDKLQELIGLLDEAPQVTELTICVQGGEQVTIKKPQRVSNDHTRGDASISGQSPVATMPIPNISVAPESQASTDGQAGSVPTKLLSITANRVGVFHTAKPRIEIGDKIVNGQIVGFIESIKLMNEIRSDVDGTMNAQLLEGGTPVEYGQQLYAVNPV